jgi:SAM-dependent methyltransferase
MGFRRSIREAIKRSALATTAAFVADNYATAWGLSRADAEPDADAEIFGAGADRVIEYSRNNVLSYERGNGRALTGRIAEVGPGGNIAVGLLLLQRGATSVDLVDRFARPQSMDAQRAALDRLSDGTRPANLFHHVGANAAAEVFFRPGSDYDYIVSCAALEHFYDPLQAMASMASALRPGGSLLHQVDLRDHGMFTRGGFHELKFLETPAWLWPHMTRAKGRPNRARLPVYRSAAQAAGLSCDIWVSHLAGVGALPEKTRWSNIPSTTRQQSIQYVDRHRTRFAGMFKEYPSEDLAVTSFFMKAQRPL